MLQCRFPSPVLPAVPVVVTDPVTVDTDPNHATPDRQDYILHLHNIIAQEDKEIETLQNTVTELKLTLAAKVLDGFLQPTSICKNLYLLPLLPYLLFSA